jgi:hypothetical protein
MAFFAVTAIMQGINEILKSQGINSDAQNWILDPVGTAFGTAINLLTKERKPLEFELTPEEEEEWARRSALILEKRRLEDEYKLMQNRKLVRQHTVTKGLQNRTAAQSQKLNTTYQTAINQAIAKPLAQTTTQPQRIKRTTEQQVADRELQQRVQNLKAQLQPAVSTATPSRPLPPSVSTATSRRPLPPSVPLTGTGSSQLLFRVMTEFNMSKRQAQKYIKRHGSD